MVTPNLSNVTINIVFEDFEFNLTIVLYMYGLYYGYMGFNFIHVKMYIIEWEFGRLLLESAACYNQLDHHRRRSYAQGKCDRS